MKNNKLAILLKGIITENPLQVNNFFCIMDFLSGKN